MSARGGRDSPSPEKGDQPSRRGSGDSPRKNERRLKCCVCSKKVTVNKIGEGDEDFLKTKSDGVRKAYCEALHKNLSRNAAENIKHTTIANFRSEDDKSFLREKDPGKDTTISWFAAYSFLQYGNKPTTSTFDASVYEDNTQYVDARENPSAEFEDEEDIIVDVARREPHHSKPMHVSTEDVSELPLSEYSSKRPKLELLDDEELPIVSWDIVRTPTSATPSFNEEDDSTKKNIAFLIQFNWDPAAANESIANLDIAGIRRLFGEKWNEWHLDDEWLICALRTDFPVPQASRLDFFFADLANIQGIYSFLAFLKTAKTISTRYDRHSVAFKFMDNQYEEFDLDKFKSLGDVWYSDNVEQDTYVELIEPKVDFPSAVKPRHLGILPAVRVDGEKVPFHEDQMKVGTILFDRILEITKNLHFEGIEFRICTPSFETLKVQTMERLLAVADQIKQGIKVKESVLPYIFGGDYLTSWQNFRKSVVRNKKILHIVVADEAHYAAVKGGINSMYVNDACPTGGAASFGPKVSEIYPTKEEKGKLLKVENFLVLLVSATPYNLLSENSRIPQADQSDSRIVDWNEHLLKGDFERRLISYANWKVGENPNNFVTLDREKGEVKVRNKPTDGPPDNGFDSCLKFKRRPDGNFHVSVSNKFWCWDEQNNKIVLVEEEAEATNFRCNVNAGHDILYLDIPSHAPTDLLKVVHVQEDGSLFVRGLPKDAPFRMGSGSPGIEDDNNCKLKWQFVMRPVDEASVRYFSLTYFVNSLREDKEERKLIRQDDNLINISKSRRKVTPTDLMADYVYSILHFGSFWFEEDEIAFKTTEINLARLKALLKMQHGQLVGIQERLKNSIQDFQIRFQSRLRTELRTTKSQKESEVFFVFEYMELWKKDTERCRAQWIGEVFALSEVKAICAWTLFKHYPWGSEAESLEKRLLENIQSYLSQLPEEKLKKYFDLARTETEIIIQDLVINNHDSENKLDGKMKIIRVLPDQKSNDQHIPTMFFHALDVACEVTAMQEAFAVIADFGKFDIERDFADGGKDSYKFWKHRLGTDRKIKQYEDLNKLPCILILVQKGRMGDTFPPSFNCMDLRLVNDTNRAKPILSVVVQELGRMCRYTKNEAKLPYALVGRGLYRLLRDGIQSEVSLSIMLGKHPDGYLKTVNSENHKKTSYHRWPVKPTEISVNGQDAANGNDEEGNKKVSGKKPHYDYQNSEEHDRRLVLAAEPQIGKTGTFLYLLKLLRDHKPPDADFAIDIADDNICPPELLTDEELWHYPWSTYMESYKPLMKHQQLTKSKYDEVNPYVERPWFYGFEFPEKVIMEKYTKMRPIDFSDAGTPSKFQFFTSASLENVDRCLFGEQRARKFDLKLAAAHLHDVIGIALPFDMDDVSPLVLRYWIPNRLVQLGINFTFDNAVQILPPVFPGELKYWVFTPSYRREPAKALLNWDKAMKVNVPYGHVIVCRSEQFEDYVTSWGGTHVIIELPDKMGKDEVSQGVGFARRFIQWFSYTQSMDFIYMADDNLWMMKKIQISPGNKKGSFLPTMNCSILEVMKHLNRMTMKEEVAPTIYVDEDYQKRTLTTNMTMDEYIGGIDRYGAIGVFRSDRINSLKPFKRGQVYSFVLYNMRAVKKQDIWFECWPFWEDTNFNEKLDRNGLHVCKINLFVQVKQYSERIGPGKALPAAIPEQNREIQIWNFHGSLKDRVNEMKGLLPLKVDNGGTSISGIVDNSYISDNIERWQNRCDLAVYAKDAGSFLDAIKHLALIVKELVYLNIYWITLRRTNSENNSSNKDTIMEPLLEKFAEECNRGYDRKFLVAPVYELIRSQMLPLDMLLMHVEIFINRKENHPDIHVNKKVHAQPDVHVAMDTEPDLRPHKYQGNASRDA